MLKWLLIGALAVLLVLTFAYDTRFAALGAFLLLGGIVYAFVRNRASATPGEIARAERGARELREEIEEDNAGERRDSAPQTP